MKNWKAAPALTALVLSFAAAAPALALDFAGLNNRNEIVLFSDRSPGTIKVIPMTGAQGKIIGLDVRPADGRLYAWLRTVLCTPLIQKQGPLPVKPSYRSCSIQSIMLLLISTLRRTA